MAGYMQSMMYQVTHNPGGTAYATAGPQATGGITIDGKTGTAQNGVNNGNLNDAVFTCFVPGSGGCRRRSPSASSCRAAVSARTRPRPSPCR